jgi:hypothetical protein
MSVEKRLIGHAPFPVAAATLGSAHVAGYGADLPRMEETVHEHPNIAMIRRALEVDNSGDQRDAQILANDQDAVDAFWS